MNTEITDKEKFNGWVLYDGDCRLCTGTALHFRRLLGSRHFKVMPLQTPWVRRSFALSDAELLREMRLLKPDGKSMGGVDALLEIARCYWWTWPLRLIGRIPFMMPLLRAAYEWIARNRQCINGACGLDRRIPRSNTFLLTILPLLVLPAVALMAQARLAPWVFMWAMAFALYGGCKWLTYRMAVRQGISPGLPRVFGYLLAWPGMDAVGFLDNRKIPARPKNWEWVFAFSKMIFGAVLLWDITRIVLPYQPILAGWLGMIGFVFMLHFGSFHLLSLAWRQAGVSAAPVMQNPLMSKSLADFWGGRWNTAFNELAFRFTFRPLRRWMAPGLATLCVFVLSGLIHESVISLPAHGGYGLPTFYFTIQGLGVIVERSRWGHFIGLGRGARGWTFMFFVLVGPVYWLFHPPFINHVILPMLKDIGAT